MYSITLNPLLPPSPFSILKISTKPIDIKPKILRFRRKNRVFRASHLENTKRPVKFNPDLSPTQIPEETLNVSEKIRLLASEFKALPEPIDRVKMLLHYASLLPRFNESGRVIENRVTGCTTQVWLEAWMDYNGSMRFRADSDSEITKGFSSCLVWVLDGAAPMEVLSVGAEDLADMNVGLPITRRSRVNTWHNVLISMQSRTRDCVQKNLEII